MQGYYISVNVRAESVEEVRNAVIGVCEDEKMPLIQVEPAERVVDNEDRLPDGDDWYGILVSGHLKPGWTTVYVDDWKDSGMLARTLSERLKAPVMEIWVAQDIHWGYTYFEGGEVLDRYADDPTCVADAPDEEPLYKGEPGALAAISALSAEDIQAALDRGRAQSGDFAGVALSGFCDTIALPFERVFTSYEHFFTDDPEDYIVEHPDWSQFRHLAFRLPEDRDSLSG
jgi:hypothetical protein